MKLSSSMYYYRKKHNNDDFLRIRMVESFNGKLRDECLSVHWFLSMEDAKQKISHWKEEYNCFRSNSSLGVINSEVCIQQQTL
jgi:hypothetical protein